MRERLNFSNVTSVVALFIALGGGAYALEKNSIGSKEIEASAVKSKEIADGAVKSKDVKADTLTAAQIAPGAIGGSELADGAVTAPELGGGAVGSAAILDGAVAGVDLLDGSITGADVDNNSITGADVNESTLSGVPPSGNAGGDLDGTYPNPTIGSNTIGPSQLESNSVGADELVTPPHLKTYGSVQTIPNSAVTDVTFGLPQYSSNVTWDNTADTATIVVPGLYVLGAQVSWESNATGRRTLQVKVNGSLQAEDLRDAVATARTSHSTSLLIELEAGDEVSASVLQTSGGDLGLISTGPPGPTLDIHWVGPTS